VQLKRLSWCVTEKATVTSVGSLKRLPQYVTEKTTQQLTKKATPICHWKCYPDLQLKRLLWRVTKKATVMSDWSLKRLLRHITESLLWRVTEKATLMSDRSLERLYRLITESLLWCVTKKATVMSDGSLKRLRWQVMCQWKGYQICHWKGYPNMSLKRLIWLVTEKAPSTCFNWITDKIITQFWSL
jgi:hypothetical protein